VIERFERRLETESNISADTHATLLGNQRKNDFGDDEEILERLVVAFDEDE
jgi:hypothetical protein